MKTRIFIVAALASGLACKPAEKDVGPLVDAPTEWSRLTRLSRYESRAPPAVTRLLLAVPLHAHGCDRDERRHARADVRSAGVRLLGYGRCRRTCRWRTLRDAASAMARLASVVMTRPHRSGERIMASLASGEVRCSWTYGTAQARTAPLLSRFLTRSLEATNKRLLHNRPCLEDISGTDVVGEDVGQRQRERPWSGVS